jgi:nucleotide sugar dehydrogenase
MSDFSNLILKNKKVAVWGLGYLGYTMILKLQTQGFAVRVYDFDRSRLQMIAEGCYPALEQYLAWSSTGNIPPIDMTKLQIAATEAEMFSDDVQVHIICFPASNPQGRPNENLARISSVFKNNYTENNRPLVIFQSVSIPGSIAKEFIEPLGDAKERFYAGTAFRSDWSIEDFINSRETTYCASNTRAGLEALRFFISLNEIEARPLCTIKEAELLENARNALRYTATSFINQIALAYPDTNVAQIAHEIMPAKFFQDCKPGLGAGGFRMAGAVDNVIKGTEYGHILSILSESQFVNLSTMLCYAEYIKRRKYSNVAILGVSYSGTQKELGLSPSMVIAETLIKTGVKVMMHDPLYSGDEIQKIIRNVNYFDYNTMNFDDVDVILLASSHQTYKQITQEVIDEKIKGKVRLIIDSSNSWSCYRFQGGTAYHRTGDGTIDILK